MNTKKQSKLEVAHDTKQVHYIMRYVIVKMNGKNEPMWVHTIFPLKFTDCEMYALRMHEEDVVRATKELLRFGTSYEVYQDKE